MNSIVATVHRSGGKGYLVPVMTMTTKVMQMKMVVLYIGATRDLVDDDAPRGNHTYSILSKSSSRKNVHKLSGV
eukprot:1864780-Ditylum_brightwellii.AAC.1